MTPLVTFSDVSKRFGALQVFENLSFSIEEGESLGVLGPNGAGKSTLLKLIAFNEDLDSGEILRRKALRVSYVAQEAIFPEDSNAEQLADDIAERAAISTAERHALVHAAFSRFAIDYTQSPVRELSGGQRKRLQIALAYCEVPELLLLDEPTNHLDIEAILQLERILREGDLAWIAVSHDRWFLENAPLRVAEVSREYESGILLCDGSYSEFLKRKEEYRASAEKSLNSFENKVRQEKAWLRQGARARSTKSKHRIERSQEMMESLSLVRARTQRAKTDMEFQFSERKTKRLIEIKNVDVGYGQDSILKEVNLKLLAGEALGVLGRNGSGKTTFMRLLSGELTPQKGTIKQAPDLALSYFQQIDQGYELQTPLKDVLAPESDSVVYRGKVLHVQSWAKRFAFSFGQLQQPFGSLSGGEKARARVARLMLESPDVLILDEPTNDLDIETLEVLEESLVTFQGAIVLVSHDRFMLNRVCTHFLGLDGRGGSKTYADYEQWERETSEPLVAKKVPTKQASEPKQRSSKSSKRLSYMEQREFDAIEEAILAQEEKVSSLEKLLSAPEVQADSQRLAQHCAELDRAQLEVERLYARWQELTLKQEQ